MYAKLVNGELIPAPTNFRGVINYNRFPERMIEDGYKPVERSVIPEDGLDKYDENGELIEKASKSYESQYQEKKNKIVQVWKEINE